MIDHYNNKDENFSWFKVVATHQVGHLEFGSFEYDFNNIAAQFEDQRRFELESERKAQMVDLMDPEESEGNPLMGAQQVESYTDIGRLLSLFDDRKLAFDLFTVLEDCRLDFRIRVEYPGIRQASERVQIEARSGRPNIQDLPLQEALVEILIHMSLEQFTDLPVPSEYQEEAEMLAKILLQLRVKEATVEDTGEAVLRAYEIISRVKNEEQPEEDWDPQDLDDPGDFSEEEYQSLLDKLKASQEQSGEGGEGDPYESPEPVDYRGDFKPEMVQLLTKLQMDQDQEGEGQPLSQEQIEQLLEDSAELELDAEQGEINNSMSAFAQNIMKEAGTPPPNAQPGQGYGPLLNDDDQGGELEAREPKTYVYDEWDFRANDYKPRWCIVKEKVLEEGEPTFYADSLKNYASVMANVKRQFELIMPERFRKIDRLPDGEDLDLNAALEAYTDLRMGLPPDDRIYWHRDRIQRDVAVVFLLDMSASTAEAIDEGRHTVDDRDAPDDPVEYMVWLRRRREGLVRRHYKRIIDLEKESTALLINALESLGDTYGIYGFSGYGRENVEFYVVKDINENFNDKIKRRIDKITPLHATRMGSAIRHCITKLEGQDASTKILFLISDGRPQDRGYSREGVEKEYAVHDTHMALIEAKRKDITPFCLTVDKAGHDYLQTMCGDMGYEVLDDIFTLPERLPMLYRRLTV